MKHQSPPHHHTNGIGTEIKNVFLYWKDMRSSRGSLATRTTTAGTLPY